MHTPGVIEFWNGKRAREASDDDLRDAIITAACGIESNDGRLTSNSSSSLDAHLDNLDALLIEWRVRGGTNRETLATVLYNHGGPYAGHESVTCCQEQRDTMDHWRHVADVALAGPP